MNPNDDMEQFNKALTGQPGAMQSQRPAMPTPGGNALGIGHQQLPQQVQQTAPMADASRPVQPQVFPVVNTPVAQPVPVRPPVTLPAAVAAFRQGIPAQVQAQQNQGSYAQPTPPARPVPIMNGVGNNPNGNPQAARLAQLIENWRRMRGGY